MGWPGFCGFPWEWGLEDWLRWGEISSLSRTSVKYCSGDAGPSSTPKLPPLLEGPAPSAPSSPEI